jgi:hypothetical protein
MITWKTTWLLLALLSAPNAGSALQDENGTAWQRAFEQRLAAFGHRNWIVVADSAYPAQSRPGVETIVTGQGQVEVLQAVLEQLNKTKHIRPNVWLDAELAFVDDQDARGVERYRERLKRLLGSRNVQTLAHERIIGKLDKAAETFKVLILKTDMTLPYTSVFLELDCGYWGPGQEKKLREAMAGEQKPKEDKNER